MGRRPQPAKITTFRLPSGGLSYRITATIHGKRQKRETIDQEEALEIQRTFEVERSVSARSLRPRITSLPEAILRRAELAWELAKGADLDLVDAVQLALKHQIPAGAPRMLVECVAGFLATKQGFVSAKQHENYRLTGARFCQFSGAIKIAEVTTESVRAWLRSLSVAPKTWNTYRNDLSAIFASFVAHGWLNANPVQKVERYNWRMIGQKPPDRLTIDDARRLMHRVEAEHPEWVTYFALALFAGIRPYLGSGEMAELAKVVKRDGLVRYYRDGVLDISAEVSKVGTPRQVHFSENLLHWLERYPLSAESICPARRRELYDTIRPKFGLTHDSLRHTAISAHVARHGQLALAALEFGTSETIIRRHYLNRMSAAEAADFFAILPADSSQRDAA